MSPGWCIYTSQFEHLCSTAAEVMDEEALNRRSWRWKEPTQGWTKLQNVGMYSMCKINDMTIGEEDLMYYLFSFDMLDCCTKNHLSNSVHEALNKACYSLSYRKNRVLKSQRIKFFFSSMWWVSDSLHSIPQWHDTRCKKT